MSFELHELVAEARSPCSTSVTASPRPAASRAMPTPLIPPPITRTSIMPSRSRKSAPFVPPEQPDRGLGVGDDALAHPIERIRDLHLEGLEVLADVELRAHVLEAARAVELDHLGGVADARIEARDLPPLAGLVAALLDQFAPRGVQRRLARLELARGQLDEVPVLGIAILALEQD